MVLAYFWCNLAYKRHIKVLGRLRIFVRECNRWFRLQSRRRPRFQVIQNLFCTLLSQGSPLLSCICFNQKSFCLLTDMLWFIRDFTTTSFFQAISISYVRTLYLTHPAATAIQVLEFLFDVTIPGAGDGLDCIYAKDEEDWDFWNLWNLGRLTWLEPCSQWN